MPKSFWTPVRLRTLSSLREAGKGPTEIARALGCTKKVVDRKCMQLDRPSEATWNEANTKQLHILTKQGKVPKEIAKILHLTTGQINGKMKREGLVSPRRCGPNSYSKEENQIIKDMRAQGKNTREIHLALPHRSYKSVQTHICDLGLGPGKPSGAFTLKDRSISNDAKKSKPLPVPPMPETNEGIDFVLCGTWQCRWIIGISIEDGHRTYKCCGQPFTEDQMNVLRQPYCLFHRNKSERG